MCFSANVERHFFKLNNVGRHFFPDFQDFAQIIRNFAQIFDKSTLLGGALASLPPPPTPLAHFSTFF